MTSTFFSQLQTRVDMAASVRIEQLATTGIQLRIHDDSAGSIWDSLMNVADSVFDTIADRVEDTTQGAS